MGWLTIAEVWSIIFTVLEKDWEFYILNYRQQKQLYNTLGIALEYDISEATLTGTLFLQQGHTSY